MSESWVIPTPLTAHDRAVDALAFEGLAEVQRSTAPLPVSTPISIPDKFDLSKHLRLIRDQNGGAGCFGYAMLAVWDIMNDIACPYSPSLSMRIWLLLHHRRELWEPDEGIYTPDGRFHTIPRNTGPEFGLFQSLGNTTEGTELTAREGAVDWPVGTAGQPWTWTKLWTVEGINEASNYRLKPSGDRELFVVPSTVTVPNPTQIIVSSQNFVNALANSRPIRLRLDRPQAGQGHFVAVVGYDKSAATFTYVNSAGDAWGQDGFETFTFQDIDTKQIDPNRPYGTYRVASAEIISIHAPRPVPTASIAIKHTNRSNVHLWLYAENSPLLRNKIWPQGWKENSRNLSFTVRLPTESIWPPSASNRLVLELYDAAEFSNSGGQLVEFTTAFGGHVGACSQLGNGPVGFTARQRLQLCIP